MFQGDSVPDLMKNHRYEILKEIADDLRLKLGPQMDAITVQRAVIGLFFTGVILSNGKGGICPSPEKEIAEAVYCPGSPRAIPECGKLAGKPVAEYLNNLRRGGPLQTALTIAVLNALSATYWKHKPSYDYYFQ
jgi:uncharacterized protein